jgi:hypothetical protein
MNSVTFLPFRGHLCELTWPNSVGLHITSGAYHQIDHISTHSAVLIKTVAVWRYEADSTSWQCFCIKLARQLFESRSGYHLPPVRSQWHLTVHPDRSRGMSDTIRLFERLLFRLWSWFQTGDGLYWLRYLVVFLSPARQIKEKYPLLGRNSSLSHNFQLVFH